MEARVDGKVILVTGSTQGIGQAIALECAHGGAKGIIVTGRDAKKGEAVVAQLAGLCVKAQMVVADLSSPGAAERLFDQASAAFGEVDALVNAAGLTTRASMMDASREDWRTLFQVNAETPFFLMQRLMKHLRDRGRPGAIVNILSMNGHGGIRDLTVYSATKAALALITRNAAHHHRFDRIRINGINVGWTDTPAERTMQAVTLGQGQDWLERAAKLQPFGRLLTPEDIARLTVYLLSESSSPMTGSIVDQEQWVAGVPDS